jgi:hypothetical protein
MSVNPQVEEAVACDVCHRTMLKGERAEPYLTPSRERRHVCELCAPRAQHEGWIREAAAPHEPARPQRPPERRGLFRRARRREAPAEPRPESTPKSKSSKPKSESKAEPASDTGPAREPSQNGEGHAPNGATPVLSRLRKRATGPRSPRHVRAVPTNAQLKIDRALDLFNASEHPRTVAGIARTLGAPRASAITSRASAAEVILTVAWELSWYEFTVDLSDASEPVHLRSQGQELGEISEEALDWNLEAGPEGTLAPIGPDGDADEDAPAVGNGVDLATDEAETIGEDSRQLL